MITLSFFIPLWCYPGGFFIVEELYENKKGLSYLFQTAPGVKK